MAEFSDHTGSDRVESGDGKNLRYLNAMAQLVACGHGVGERGGPDGRAHVGESVGNEPDQRSLDLASQLGVCGRALVDYRGCSGLLRTQRVRVGDGHVSELLGQWALVRDGGFGLVVRRIEHLGGNSTGRDQYERSSGSALEQRFLRQTA